MTHGLTSRACDCPESEPTPTHRLDWAAIATAAFVAAKLNADRGLVAPKMLSNLCDALIGFHEAVNLISFDLAEVFVIHRATSTGRSRSLEC
jgi:hypothetical protein